MAEDPISGVPVVARRCLPVHEWPEPDRAAWAAAHRRGGLLDDDGLASSWAPPTSDLIARGYGTFLAFLARTGDFDPTAPPAARVTRPRIESYVAYLRERNHSSTVAARILQLIRGVAVMAPTADLAWLRLIAARLRRLARPARDDRIRIVPAVTLSDLSFALMKRAETRIDLPIRVRALLFRDGLMIAILCACALRARNLAAMSIGKSLQRRGDIWWVRFGSEETKNRRPIELPLPEAFTRCVDRYLDYYRPQLRRSAVALADALWISNGGQRLTPKAIRQSITIVTRRELVEPLTRNSLEKSFLPSLRSGIPRVSVSLNRSSGMPATHDAARLQSRPKPRCRQATPCSGPIDPRRERYRPMHNGTGRARRREIDRSASSDPYRARILTRGSNDCRRLRPLLERPPA